MTAQQSLDQSQAHNQQVDAHNDLVTLYRSVGPGQLQSIEASGWKAFPKRFHWQRYFYPMLHESFAHKIASQWNVEQSGVGYVLRFQVRKEYLASLPIYMVGGPEHREYRIPSYELDAFNQEIVGEIEVLASYSAPEDIQPSKWQRSLPVWSQPQPASTAWI